MEKNRDGKPGIWDRHRIRHTSTGLDFALADSISYLDGNSWDAIASHGSIFASRNYLELLEAAGMEDVAHRYALIFDKHEPVACVAVQLYHWRAERLLDDPGENGVRNAWNDLRRRALQGLDQKLLVCGNLVSSGLHGVAIHPDADQSLAWSGVAEALYRIRRAERLTGQFDFILVKDFKGDEVDLAAHLETYSYRRIQADPDMLLELPADCGDFDAYLALLNTKYRSRLKRIRRQVEDAGLVVESLADPGAVDAELHALYSQVEQQAAVRTAALPAGYFGKLARRFPDDIRYSAIRDGDRLVGFISTVRESDGTALAYYVGMDYETNKTHPIYLRLLQCVVEDALAMGCRTISFGRTASEPKAALGAKPKDTWFWARHRLPAANWFVRKLFPLLPYEEAAERNAFRNSGEG